MNSPFPTTLAGADIPQRQPDFYFNHLLAPMVGVLALSAILMGGGVDLWIADHLYRWEGGHWLLKDAWITSDVIHRAGKWLSVSASVLVIAALLRSSLDPRWQHYRRPLLYLLLAIALSTGVVSLLKSVTAMDCPWDLSRYGGSRSLVGLFESRPADMPRAACFPAGHASAGYAWVALYFFAWLTRPRWRYALLAAALLTGAVFGIGQQLRGAHFLSHDLWSLAISWCVALGLFLLMFRATPAPPSAHCTGAPSTGASV
jgi:membrane-associated PAP2 superfamily phosphatase